MPLKTNNTTIARDSSLNFRTSPAVQWGSAPHHSAVQCMEIHILSIIQLDSPGHNLPVELDQLHTVGQVKAQPQI